MARLKSLKRRKLTSGMLCASGRRLRREESKAEAQNKSELSAGTTGQRRFFDGFGEDGNDNDDDGGGSGDVDMNDDDKDGYTRDVRLNEKELVCLLQKYFSLSLSHQANIVEKDVTVLTACIHATTEQSSGDAELSTLPLDGDLQEFQQENQYNEPCQNIKDAADGIPTMDFDDVDALTESETEAEATPASAPTAASATMGPPSCRPSQPGEEDTSTLVRHHHYYDDSISQFETALGLWATNVGISRSEYTGLREILHLVLHRDTGALPGSLTTLKRRLNRQLPLLDMRTKDIPLIREKLPTDTATCKACGVDEVPHETLHFFDPECLFKAFMSSDFAKSMHIGMAH